MPAPGLVPHNLRLLQPDAPQIDGADDSEVTVDMGGDAPETDDNGNILKIEHPDGSITISLDGKSLDNGGESDVEGAREWFRNLVDDIEAGELTRISHELMTGIEDDLEVVAHRGVAMQVERPGALEDTMHLM